MDQPFLPSFYDSRSASVFYKPGIISVYDGCIDSPGSYEFVDVNRVDSTIQSKTSVSVDENTVYYTNCSTGLTSAQYTVFSTNQLSADPRFLPIYDFLIVFSLLFLTWSAYRIILHPWWRKS